VTRPVPRLLVETREVELCDDLLLHTSPGDPLVWMRRGDGMAGFGTALTLTSAGDDRVADLAAQWRAVAASASVTDDVHQAGTGLLAFGALTFDATSGRRSVLTVPSIVVGRRAGRCWVTTIRREGDSLPEPAQTPWGPYWSGTLGPGAQTAGGYMTSVGDAVARIRAGEVGKVVLARDLRGSVPENADLRRLARALASDYPDTWTFAVDGLIGASPETLVTVHGGTITARVLAGTTPRGADADADIAAATALASSGKDLDEHAFAVRSVVAALSPHTRALATSESPFTLKLPNVWHLATDVDGELAGAASALDLVGVLHPTAAVAGTPTAAAIDVIRQLEPFDRGRYAGPVGWIDGDGDGEWAIALRCAQFEPDAGTVTAYAGAGIVAGSDPETEMLETRVKFRPIVDALA
jgi:menaquinone-specific isochorismate synthase